MTIGELVLKILGPVLELIAPLMPGEIFPYFFTMEMFQRSLIAALISRKVATLCFSCDLIASFKFSSSSDRIITSLYSSHNLNQNNTTDFLAI